MAIVSKTNKDGVDIVIDAIQQRIHPQLLGFWVGAATYECYPRANKNYKADQIIPEISLDQKDYKEVLNDDKFSVTSFFLVDNERTYQDEWGQIKQEISIIFQCDLVELYGATERFDEQFNMDVLRVLKAESLYIVDDIEFTEGIDDVYSDLTITGPLKDNIKRTDISQFHVLKATFNVLYTDKCERTIAPVCLPCFETFNGASISNGTSGGTKDIIVQSDASGNPQVGVKITDTADDLVIEVPAAGGIPAVFYNRPYLTQTISFDTNDEGFRRINGGNDHNDAIPDTATLQQIEPDFANSRPDFLRYFNVHGHKFQYTGILGGYFDPFDGNYYDKDGVLSDQATEFPVVSAGKWWVENHLNGSRMISDRSGSQTWTQAMNSPDTFVFDGVSTGWLNFIKGEAIQLNSDSNQTFSIFVGNPDRPFFVYTQPEQWTGTTRPNLTTMAYTYLGATNGGTISGRTKTQSVQRWHFIYHFTGSIPQP